MNSPDQKYLREGGVFMSDNKEVKVAILGLGRVGSKFMGKLAEKSSNGIKIVAAAERDSASAGIEEAKSQGVAVHNDSKDVVAMGEDIDIIFDLTGNVEARKALRSDLARSGNQHTVIAPEVVAFLIWDLMGGESGALPRDAGKSGY